MLIVNLLLWHGLVALVIGLGKDGLTNDWSVRILVVNLDDCWVVGVMGITLSNSLHLCHHASSTLHPQHSGHDTEAEEECRKSPP